MPPVGKTLYFGYRKTPHTVTRSIPWDSARNGHRRDGIIGTVYLKGPRGGEYRATVYENGRCRKI